MPDTELGHIGDGVYLSHDGFQYWLAVNDHRNKVIALEPQVVASFVETVCNHDDRMSEIIRRARGEGS